MVELAIAGLPPAAIEGGVIVRDLDGDELPELVSFGLVSPVAVHHNEGGLVFTGATAAVGLDPARSASAGAAGDLDGDGDPDLLFATRLGALVYENLGDGTFADRSEGSGLSAAWETSSIALVDLDGDGLLDIYLGRTGESADDRIYRNAGGLTFTDVTSAAGLAERGQTWAVSIFDHDGDGDLDVYVANDTFVEDFDDGALGPVDVPVDALLDNRSAGGAIALQDVTIAVGLEEPRSSMGGLVSDVDGDGVLDLYISNVGRNRLFTGSAGGAFTDDTARLDVGAARRSALACASSTDPACLLVSWGAIHADLDLDGVDELLFVNGHIEGAAAQPAVRLVPSGAAFERAASGLACTAARALVTADLDGDGDLDAVVTGSDAPMRVYENVSAPGGGWLVVALAGTSSNTDGIGAVVTLTVAGGRRVTRAIGAGGVVHSSGPPEAHLGLGSASIERLEVRWPSGAVQSVPSVDRNQRLVISEP